MRTKKWLLLAAVLALLLSVAVGMTLGDDSADGQTIEIEQILQQRVFQRDDNMSVDNLCPFETDKPLLPAYYVGEPTLAPLPQAWPAGGSDLLLSDTVNTVVDKFVSVRNGGSAVAYVRTWFAFEMGDLTAEEFQNSLLIHRNESVWHWSEFHYDVVIDGRRYAIVSADYQEALRPGETTSHPSLLQVMLYRTVTADIAARLDGNGDGKYEIKAYTMGISDDRAWPSAAPTHPWGA